MTTVAFTILTTMGFVLLGWRRAHIRGTTLQGPWAWTLVSVISISAIEFGQSAGFWAAAHLPALRFAATATSFCPLVALLGAQKPQNQAWNFIVLSLWVVLILPVLESLVMAEGPPDIQGARSWFMLALLVLGVLNFLPTRYWAASLLFGIAQFLLLNDTLPLGLSVQTRGWPPVLPGYCLLVASIGCTVAIGARPIPAIRSLDRVWLDFRDSFGLLWGLRISERINSTAERYDWNLMLRWNGFHRKRPEAEAAWSLPDSRQALHQTLSNLLRRFVSREWLAERHDMETASR